MAQFPSSIISFPTWVNGQVIDADNQNSPNAEITAIENFIGTQSSTAGIAYDVRSPSSNGGGHVQTADKGGTGQTSYNKGDILVAQGPSVLGKQAAGPDNYALIYDSTQTNGVRADAVLTEANARNQSATYAVASVLSASVWGITFPNIVSVLSSGQAFQVRFPTANTSSMIALQVSSLLAQRIVNPDLTNPAVGAIQPSMIAILEGDGTNFQIASVTRQSNGLYNCGQTSRSAAAGTGTQTIAHGLGTIPKLFRVSYFFAFGTNAARGAGSGACTSIANQSSSDFSGTNNTNSTGFSTTNIIHVESSAEAAVSAIDATNVTLNFTAAVTAGGSDLLIQWEAFA